MPAIGKPPKDITLLEIYRAVEGEKPLLHLDTHTNPECGIGVNIQLALADYYARIYHEVKIISGMTVSSQKFGQKERATIK